MDSSLFSTQSSRRQNHQHQISIDQNCSKAQTVHTEILPGAFATKTFLVLDLSQSITLKHLRYSFIVTTHFIVNLTVAAKFDSCTLSNRQSTVPRELPKDGMFQNICNSGYSNYLFRLVIGEGHPRVGTNVGIVVILCLIFCPVL
jgi:hypothetical protein